MNGLRVSIAAFLVLPLGGCEPSPVSFSPDGQHIALVTTQTHPPSGDESQELTTRMVIVGILDKKVRVLDEADGTVFSPPAFRPDGKAIAYLRMPLPDEEEKSRRSRANASGRVSLYSQQQAIRKEWGLPELPQFDEGLVCPPLPGRGGMVPPFDNAYKLSVVLMTTRPGRATLVVRDVTTGKVTSQATVWLLLMNGIASVGPEAISLVRPQFSADGRIVFFCVGNMLLGVDPVASTIDVLATPAEKAVLSPDGGTIAVFQKGAVGFLRPSEGVTLYKSLSNVGDIMDLTWKNNDIVLLLTGDANSKEDGDAAVVSVLPVKRDGSVQPAIRLPELDDPLPVGKHLAVSPDGRHMVAAFGKDTFFMNADGKVLKNFRNDGQTFASPVFSPDGKTVAMKHMALSDRQNGGQRCSLKLFSPDGKEVLDIPEPQWPHKSAGIPKPKPLEAGPALYVPAKGQTVLILTNDNEPQNEATRMFTDVLGQTLVSHGIFAKAVTSTELEKYHKAGGAQDRASIGKAFSADVILWVALNAFPTTKEYTDRARNMAPTAKLWLVTPAGKTLWPNDNLGHEVRITVPLGKEPLTKEKEDAFRKHAWDLLAEKISRCFYDSRTPAPRLPGAP